MFFTPCVKAAIAKRQVTNLTETDTGFNYTINYPIQEGELAGGGSAMFVFEKQAEVSYKITIISCAGGCEDDNCEQKLDIKKVWKISTLFLFISFIIP